MAGDAQTDVLSKKKGVQDAEHTAVLHINLVDLNSDSKAQPAPTSPAKSAAIPLEVAQAAAPTPPTPAPFNVLNRNTSGPTSKDGNPYAQPGGGVAPAFEVNGKRPQDAINTPGTKAPDWQAQAATGQARLDAAAAQGQAQRQQIEAAQGNATTTTAQPTDHVDSNGNQVHQIGGLGLGYAALMSVPYAQYAHPLLQRWAVPKQLALDAKAEAGEMTPLGKVADYLPKAYLKYTSPTYIAQSELKKILPIETTARQHLASLETTTKEELEALRMKKADVANLETIAKGSPTTPEAIAEQARAQRQLDFLEAHKASKIPTRKAIEDANEKLDFLKKNNKYVAGGEASEGTLNWSNFQKTMQEKNLFSKNEMQPVADIAQKEQPFIKIGTTMMGRTQLEAVERATEAGKGFWGTAWSLGKKIAVPLAITGTESMGQIALARHLGDNDGSTWLDRRQNDIARIIQPTVPGAVAKDLGLMLGSNAKVKAAMFAGANLYEFESNMTSPERIGTMILGLAPAGIALAKADKPLALGLAVADAGIGIAAEITSRFYFNDSKASANAAKAVTDISSNPKDISHGTLQNGVDEMKEIGKADPFLLTHIYDQAHTKGAEAQATDSPLTQQAKYKQQLILGQAQGETILDNGLTQSQYLKMQNRDVAIPDPSEHKEQYRIAPTQHIDIGGQATRTLIGAVGSANLLDWAAAKQGNDTSGVDKQKQEMKAELKDLLTGSHQGQMENAIKDSTWGFGKTVNDMDLVEFWKKNNFDYAHINTLIRDTATYYAGVLPQMQQSLTAAQSNLDQAKANPASPTDVAEKQALYNARNDALGLTTLWVGKLYRDEALMKLGQVQYMLDNAHEGHTADPRDIVPQLVLAQTAIDNSDKYAPGNPDEKILRMMTGKMYVAAKLIPPTNFQPNP